MDEFQPLSDMRASAAYRRAMLGQLLRRGWHGSAHPGAPTLANLQPEGLT